MGNGFSQIINMLIQCGSSALGWMESVFSSIGILGLNSPKVLVRAMIVAMLSVRFILYPFLKGRVVGGVGEELGRTGSRRAAHYVYDNSDHYNPRSSD